MQRLYISQLWSTGQHECSKQHDSTGSTTRRINTSNKSRVKIERGKECVGLNASGFDLAVCILGSGIKHGLSQASSPDAQQGVDLVYVLV